MTSLSSRHRQSDILLSMKTEKPRNYLRCNILGYIYLIWLVVLQSMTSSSLAQFAINRVQRWPSHRIPVACYNLEPEICQSILNILTCIEYRTCLRFVPVNWRTQHKLHYLRFTSLLYSDVSPLVYYGKKPRACESQYTGLSCEGVHGSYYGELLTHQDIVLGSDRCAQYQPLVNMVVQALGLAPEIKNDNDDGYLRLSNNLTSGNNSIKQSTSITTLLNRISLIYECPYSTKHNIKKQFHNSISFKEFTRLPYV